ncbi:Spy/CpxP family protein refolding chaperone [Acaryochloris sp. IP29b_bin.137]|uniref:Spy/CpxP family protein refolding chaperone n=1 Tax=Acaryochloris sp. IP29b_bin.137 TaxID=2969217 RepID=UPI0026358FD4|nr:Spy/CpxP family protein refolding chaperone [Acaryochloris sp. IP29b_bin.137]
MSRVSKGVIICLALIGICSLGQWVGDAFPPSVAQAPERRLPRRRFRGLFRDLQLSRQQRQAIRAIRQQYGSQTREKAQLLRQTRKELKAMIASEAAEAEIRAQFQTLEQLTQENLKLRFENMMAIRDVLTPDQRQQLAQKLAERRQQRRQRRFNPEDSEG